MRTESHDRKDPRNESGFPPTCTGYSIDWAMIGQSCQPSLWPGFCSRRRRAAHTDLNFGAGAQSRLIKRVDSHQLRGSLLGPVVGEDRVASLGTGRDGFFEISGEQPDVELTQAFGLHMPLQAGRV